jgi:hypothetical protein
MKLRFGYALVVCCGGLVGLGCVEGDTSASCFDGEDNDRDGLFDCDDPDCGAFCSDGPSGDCSVGDCDGDGWTVDEGDCDDEDYDVHPEAEEACDGADNDCDGDVDEDFDLDNDGYPGADFEECAETLAADQLDCDDADISVYPGAYEDCTDGVDNDCDGDVDENVDEDGDGVSNCDGDCDDHDPAVHPGANEVCNDIDDNCDGAVDEGLPTYAYYVDADEDGYGDGSLEPVEDCGQPEGYADNADDCDDSDAAVNPGTVETPCDGVDNDCNPATSDTPDHDGDGYTICDDCDDDAPEVNPDADEDICDGVDNDCDGATPDAPDEDGDGVDACSGDCDDGDADVGMGAWVPADHATIQAAINAANDGDDICVDTGTYHESINFTGKDVRVIGVHGAQQTTLDASGPGSVVTFAGGESTDAVLKGFTIRGGTALLGGGIYIENSSPTLSELIVTQNDAQDYGGGIYAICMGGTMAPQFSKLQISDNTSAWNGGGMALFSEGPSCVLSPRLDNILVSENTASSLGAGLNIWTSEGTLDLTMTHVLVVANNAGSYIGGVFIGTENLPGSAVLDHVIVADNHAGYDTGGCKISGGYVGLDATISHSVFLRNDANRDYAGLYITNDAVVELVDSVVAENWAGSGGGGVSVDGGVLAVAGNNDVWGNLPDDWAGTPDPTGLDGNISTNPGFRSLAGTDPTVWDFHLEAASQLVDAGSDMDPNGSTGDIGAYGGPDADGWDLDWDGYYEWWLPGAFDAATSPGMDCDDQDAGDYPGHGC